MKKQRIVLCIIFSVFLLCNAVAQIDSFHSDGSFHFSCEPLFGVRYGYLGEYVYYSKNTSDKLSYLEWDIKPLWYCGERIEVGWKGFNLSTSVKGFLNSNCGDMQDSDWLQDAVYANGDRSVKTNYSKHDNSLKTGYSIDGELSCKFYVLGNLSISPLFGLEYQYMSFSAKDGTLWYGNDINDKEYGSLGYAGSYYAYDDEGHVTIKHYTGKVIEYERQDLYTWLGLAFEYLPVPKLSISVAGYIAPYVYMRSLDSHLKTGLYYLDIAQDSFCAKKVKASIQYSFTKHFALKSEVSGLITDEIHTTSNYRSTSKNDGYEKKSGENGSSSKYFESSISVKFSI